MASASQLPAWGIVTYGWCPGLFTPMPAADGLLVRVKPRLSRLDADTARAIARAVREYGNGRIELTSRANFQVRGLNSRGVAPFASAMMACGIADSDPDVERRRNLVVAPFAHGHTLDMAQALEHSLARAADLALPAKFGFAIDCPDAKADIFLTPAQGLCHIAGATNAAVADGDGALALARAFLRLGGTRRMRDLVASIGEQAIYAAAGLPLAPVSPSIPLSPLAYAITSPELDPDTLASAADFAQSQGDGLLRITGHRTVLIGGVRTRAAA